MSEPVRLTSDHPILNALNFKPFRNNSKRRAMPFSPADDEPQTCDIKTPWGAVLTAKKGDMLVSEMDAPDDRWPVDAEIFDESYMLIGIEFCIKKAITFLVPLTEITGGNEDEMVMVVSNEGEETVRAGDFYLAKGVKGEIWAYPRVKADEIMIPAG